MVVFCIPKAEARIARITGGFPNPKVLCGQLLESTLREMPRVLAPGQASAQSPCSGAGMCPESLLLGSHKYLTILFLTFFVLSLPLM